MEKKKLMHLYIEEEKSGVEISRICQCSPSTVYRNLRKHNIPIRTRSEANRTRKKYTRKHYLSAEQLKVLYHDKQLSQHDIAKLLNIPYAAINYWMKKYKIRTRDRSEAQENRRSCKFNINKSDLEDLYLKKKMSTMKIALLYGVTPTAVRRKLKKHGIRVRSLSEASNKVRPYQYKIKITREELENLYWKNSLSLSEISKRLNVCPATVFKWLNRYGIRRRTLKEACQGSMTPEKQRKMLLALGIRPTKPEQRFIEIIEKHNLPYRYTGNGDVMIGKKNPDFFNTNGNKVVIEIFGKAFHSPLFTYIDNIPYNRTYKGTIEHYKKYGLKCIIFWDRDILREDAERFIIHTLKSEGGL